MKRILLSLLTLLALSASAQKLEISDNGRFFTAAGQPFFWLGDTAWLLFNKLDREQAQRYLDDRAAKGFNVIQVSIVHTLDIENTYGFPALVDDDLSQPYLPENEVNGYWDHADWIIDQARAKGFYIAIVPVWGSNVRSGNVSREQASKYGRWLAERYRDYDNVLWLNGGDTRGSDSTATWNALGEAIKSVDATKLMTFHPLGRMASSMWFKDAKWLDFNMFQSGHRTYAQGQDEGQRTYGEDNWRYIADDYALQPVKPTLDGEPSYEDIPHGLRDSSSMRWTDDDVRRYAYWSVFAGGAGFTYGENSVMQFFRPGDNPAYKALLTWEEGIAVPGSSQMQHLKSLILSLDYFSRVPDQSLLAGPNGERHDYIAATRGKDYALFYTWTSRPFSVRMEKIPGKKVSAQWFDPKTGTYTPIGTFKNKGVREFRPAETPRPGMDKVLVLRSVE